VIEERKLNKEVHVFFLKMEKRDKEEGGSGVARDSELENHSTFKNLKKH
jgi:hypothetical protein